MTNFYAFEHRIAPGGEDGTSRRRLRMEVAATDPTANDDVSLEFGVGSRWINTANDKEYVCVDATDGAAVWQETTGAGGDISTGFHGVRVYRTAAQSLTNADYTNLAFTAEEYDTDAFHDNSTNNTRLTVPVGLGGYYHIFGAVQVTGNATGQRVVVVRKNGGPGHAQILVATSESNPGSGGDPHMTLNTVRPLDAGDYIELRVYQNSGGSLNAEVSSTTGEYLPSFGMHLMSLRGVALLASDVPLSDETPLVESGAGDPGVGTAAARDDHVHPADGGGGGGSGQGLVDFEHAKRTSGNVTCNSTSWANFDTGLDLVLTAATGDTIDVGISGWWSNEAVYCALDVATIVSGSVVNVVSGAGGGSDFGVQAWLGVTSVQNPVGGSILYELQAGDISAGSVTLRLRYRTSAGANKIMRASTTNPFHWYAKNIGPAM